VGPDLQLCYSGVWGDEIPPCRAQRDLRVKDNKGESKLRVNSTIVLETMREC
jgi:hypothetical protein